MSKLGLTMRLAKATRRPAVLSSAERTIIAQALLDTCGVAIAGSRAEAARVVANERLDEVAETGATLWGRGERLGSVDAALVNGTAAHALDYDDVNMAIPGHPSAVLVPALLALAETNPLSGADYNAAYAAGYAVMCSLGEALGVEHYDAGFHATATLGSFGAAAACARALGLSVEVTAHALGLAATSTAGLKSMFGTATKPLNAGLAARNGLLAARLASRGLRSRIDAIEGREGFGSLYARGFDPDAQVTGDHLSANLFKFHAACYLVHAAIDAVAAIPSFPLATLTRLTVRGDASLDAVCNILAPIEGQEAKFSLRAAVALALARRDTARPATFDEWAADTEAQSLLPFIQVELQPGWSKNVIEVEALLHGGETRVARHDSAAPMSDLAAQGERLRLKFHALVGPVLGRERAEGLERLALDHEALADVGVVARACADR